MRQGERVYYRLLQVRDDGVKASNVGKGDWDVIGVDDLSSDLLFVGG